jgi:5-methyltetrahydropteroyltriglutamate--homocysteine methyltransferase
MRHTNGSTVHGYPRQGPGRELKTALESHWAGRLDSDGLLAAASSLRRQRLSDLHRSGLTELVSGDFSLYDHVLDTCVMLGAIPQRHRAIGDTADAAGRLARYFAMARGTHEVPPLEMTKWFDTNYHYLVPELGPDLVPELDATKPVAEFTEALADGIVTRPVVLGPVTFLLLSKPASDAPDGFVPLSLLDRLIPLYVDLLRELKEAGAEWVQLDEPSLVTDQPNAVLDAVARCYQVLTRATDRPSILVASYFGPLGEALPVLRDSGVDGLAVDLTGPAEGNLQALLDQGGLPDRRLVAGVIDGRNVWAADLEAALSRLESLRPVVGSLDVAPSCSLLHVPLDVDAETDLDPRVADWLAFARQKLAELRILERGLVEGRPAVAVQLEAATARRRARSSSDLVHRPSVRDRAGAVAPEDTRRPTPYSQRSLSQRDSLRLPDLPTTTIGSFPQTAQIRGLRTRLRKGTLSRTDYDEAMREQIAQVIAEQEQLGLDVLVHGEPERNDMVQYFAEQLTGFLATTNGWVQSYGSRYVRPPIILGDVEREQSMTVPWAVHAQSLTDKPVKGMLTGPVTMLAWSFVRDDQPPARTARQVALALRDEVADLEAAGITVIQVDEPALRETLPLRRADRAEYLSWAVESFRLATAGVRETTQIHTHMCYADFGDILAAIADMDADVISLEAARSDMSVLDDLTEAGYPYEVGPGVWDIHSPRVPGVPELVDKLTAAVAAFPRERLWVNPDCGLKTRDYPEVRATLANLVSAARQVRAGA